MYLAFHLIYLFDKERLTRLLVEEGKSRSLCPCPFSIPSFMINVEESVIKEQRFLQDYSIIRFLQDDSKD